MKSRPWSLSFGRKSSRQTKRYTALQVQQLDDRIVPAAPTTTWAPAGVDDLWSNAANWTNGLPDATKVAVFSGMTDGCIFDNTVQAVNQTVLGLQSENGFTGTLQMTGGFGLTVLASRTDLTTGFQWGSGTISQSSLQDVLIIAGGGGANNQWSGGTICNPIAQSNLYINGASTLQITGNAQALGDNIIIGQDGGGGSVLEFLNQARTLSVTNNASIQVSAIAVRGDERTGPYSAPVSYGQPAQSPNRLLFDTDTTQIGMAHKGLSRDNTSSFIDNFGTITRSNLGTLQIDLPIRNEANSPALLDVQSNLWISGRAPNGTANVAVDQEGGTTRLGTSATLTCRGFVLNNGVLQSAGPLVGATIAADDSYRGTLLTVNGGTVSMPSISARLTVNGDMLWTGGTLDAWIDGSHELQQSRLMVAGQLTMPANSQATLHVDVTGELLADLGWSPIYYGGHTGSFTLDAPSLMAGEHVEPFAPGGPGFFAMCTVPTGDEVDLTAVIGDLLAQYRSTQQGPPITVVYSPATSGAPTTSGAGSSGSLRTL